MSWNTEVDMAGLIYPLVRISTLSAPTELACNESVETFASYIDESEERLFLQQ
jgi:hypothetical protein